MILILLLFLFVTNSIGQIELSEYPDYTPIQDFQESRYAGTWYDIWRIPNRYDDGQKCQSYDVTVYQNSSLGIDLSFTSIQTGQKTSLLGLANQINSNSSEYDFYFPISANEYSGTYVVLGTDYDNYCVILWIQPDDNNSSKYLEYAWIASRKRTLSDEKYDEAIDVLERNNISTQLQKDDQQNCS